MPETYTVQMGEEHYRIVGPQGEEGVLVPYGMLATLFEPPASPSEPPAVYFCLIDDPDTETAHVWCVDSVSPMTVELEECNFPEQIIKAQKALDEALEVEVADTTEG